MRSDLPSPLENQQPRPHEPGGPRIVLVGGAKPASAPSEQKTADVFTSEQKATSVFLSEHTQAGLAPAKSAEVDDAMHLFASELEPVLEEEPAKPPRTAPQLSWRNGALALLALIVLVQAGFMIFWLMSAPAAPPPETGSVMVTSVPLASPVSIDGVSRGSTPVTVALPPGPHRIEVGAGPQIRTQTVTVTAGGDALLHIELPPPPQPGVVAMPAGMGGLEITTDPAGARVSIDGAPRGVSPITATSLKPGPHTVTVSGPGEPVTRTVTVNAGAVASIIISMTSTSAFASGWIAISSAVPLQITEAGTLLGSTEAPRILVPAGSHELELTNTALGYRVSRTVRVTPGQTASIVLQAPQGILHINALPWAEVWIDGQRAGETPIGNFSLPIGTHELLFRHPEFGELKRPVTVGAGQPTRVGVDLRK